MYIPRMHVIRGEGKDGLTGTGAWIQERAQGL